MRGAVFAACWMLGLALPAAAEIQPETVGTARLGAAGPSWFLAKQTLGPANLFDAATGEMLGLMTLTPWTPAVQPHPARGEIYAAETYYSRYLRGDRTDVVTVYDAATLAPVAEIPVPPKIAALAFRHYIGLLGDGRHVVVFNMTPAQSVSVVDVVDRRFVGEIATPGCALVLPSGERDFLMLCGDGTVQLVRLDASGTETARLRSAAFFDVAADPVFDKPVATAAGWQLVSFDGRVFEVTVAGDRIRVSEPWSLVDAADAEQGWRVGGGQVIALHASLDLLFALMHQGGPDSHEDPGTEVWVYDRSAGRRMARIALAGPVTTMYVTPEAEPKLVAARLEGPIDIFDVRTTQLVRTIEEPGLRAGLLQAFR